MSCERYEDRLIDHALGADASDELRVHLTSCAACRVRLEDERRLASEIDTTLAVALRATPSAGFEARLRRHVETHSAPRRRPWIWMGAGLAAALMVLALVLRRPDVDAPREVAAATPPPRATEAPLVAPTPAPPLAVVETRRPPSLPRPTTTRRASAAVLVAPEDAEALRRLPELMRSGAAIALHDPSARLLVDRAAHEVDPFAVSTLEDLPRLVIAEVPRYDAEPLPRLTTGGGL